MTAIVPRPFSGNFTRSETHASGFYCRKLYHLLINTQCHISVWHRNMSSHCPRNRPSIVKFHTIVNPQLLFKQWTILTCKFSIILMESWFQVWFFLPPDTVLQLTIAIQTVNNFDLQIFNNSDGIVIPKVWFFLAPDTVLPLWSLFNPAFCILLISHVCKFREIKTAMKIVQITSTVANGSNYDS
jgi:hypothetical protein